MILAYCKEHKRDFSNTTRVPEGAGTGPGAPRRSNVAAKAAPPARWGLHRAGRAEPGQAPMEDLNDEFCRACWQGVRPPAIMDLMRVVWGVGRVKTLPEKQSRRCAWACTAPQRLEPDQATVEKSKGVLLRAGKGRVLLAACPVQGRARGDIVGAHTSRAIWGPHYCVLVHYPPPLVTSTRGLCCENCTSQGYICINILCAFGQPAHSTGRGPALTENP